MSHVSEIVGAEEARRVMERELISEERLLWYGRPQTGIKIAPSDIPAVAVGLVILFFSLAWTIGVISEGAVLMAPFGVLLMLMGLHAAGGTLVLDAWKRKGTFYGVTTNRVVVVRKTFGHRAKSQHLDTLSDLGMDRRRDGSGTITFGPWGRDEAPWKLRFSPYLPAPTLTFHQLANCVEVYEVILRARHQVR